MVGLILRLHHGDFYTHESQYNSHLSKKVSKSQNDMNVKIKGGVFMLAIQSSSGQEAAI